MPNSYGQTCRSGESAPNVVVKLAARRRKVVSSIVAYYRRFDRVATSRMQLLRASHHESRDRRAQSKYSAITSGQRASRRLLLALAAVCSKSRRHDSSSR
jgi:hypothetical protein